MYDEISHGMLGKLHPADHRTLLIKELSKFLMGSEMHEKIDAAEPAIQQFVTEYFKKPKPVDEPAKLKDWVIARCLRDGRPWLILW